MLAARVRILELVLTNALGFGLFFVVVSGATTFDQRSIVVEGFSRLVADFFVVVVVVLLLLLALLLTTLHFFIILVVVLLIFLVDVHCHHVLASSLRFGAALQSHVDCVQKAARLDHACVGLLLLLLLLLLWMRLLLVALAGGWLASMPEAAEEAADQIATRRGRGRADAERAVADDRVARWRDGTRLRFELSWRQIGCAVLLLRWNGSESGGGGGCCLRVGEKALARGFLDRLVVALEVNDVAAVGALVGVAEPDLLRAELARHVVAEVHLHKLVLRIVIGNERRGPANAAATTTTTTNVVFDVCMVAVDVVAHLQLDVAFVDVALALVLRDQLVGYCAAQALLVRQTGVFASQIVLLLLLLLIAIVGNWRRRRLWCLLLKLGIVELVANVERERAVCEIGVEARMVADGVRTNRARDGRRPAEHLDRLELHSGLRLALARIPTIENTLVQRHTYLCVDEMQRQTTNNKQRVDQK